MGNKYPSVLLHVSTFTLFDPPITPIHASPPPYPHTSSQGGFFLPVSTSPQQERGVLSNPLQLFPSPALALHLCCLSSCWFSACSPLSHRDRLHYLASNPSSKMTFFDFIKACQFNSVKLLHFAKGRGKIALKEKVYKVCPRLKYVNDIRGGTETVPNGIHLYQSTSPVKQDCVLNWTLKTRPGKCTFPLKTSYILSY